MSTPTLSQITDKVLEVVRLHAEPIPSEKVTPESLVVRDLGFDDLDVLEIAMDLEEAFSIEIDSNFEPDECETLTLQGLIDMTAKALGVAEEVTP